MVNQQKGVQQDTAYSAVVVNGHNMYHLTQKGSYKLYRQGRGYMYIIHYYRQYLVALFFAPYPPSFHEYSYLEHV